MSDPAPESAPPPPDSFNDQVRDSIRQLEDLLGGQAAPFAHAVSYQAVAHAIALGMQNAVAQQQHAHLLRNALTTAAARALLAGKREEAEAVLKLAESKLVNPDVGEELARLQAMLKSTLEDLQKTFSAGARPAPAPSA